MAISLINSFNVGDNATLQLGGASYVTTAVVGGTTYVFVTGKGGGDNGVSVFSLGDDGTLTNVFNVADNNTMNLGGAFALTTAVVGDTTYLFVCGVNDSGVSVFSVGADGSLTNTANVGDSAALKLSLSVDVETMVVGGTTYLFADGVNDNGISVFAVGADGTLTNVDNVTDDTTSNIQGPQGMATAVVGGNAYLFVTGYHDDGVGVYSVAADGHLTNVFNVRDSGEMELDGPVDAITVAVGGATYLVVSGFDDDGLTVFSVAADGHLTNVFNLPDDGTLKLDNPVGLSTTVIGGTTYLLVAGADDDGLSIFAMGADGALTNVANVSDDATLLLDRVIGVTAVTMNGQTYLIAGSNNDSGVSVFKLIDDTNHEPTLTATGNNPTFTEGGAAADIFSAPLASTIEQGQTFTSLTLTVTNVTDGADEILSFLGHDLALIDGNSVAGATVSVAGTTATVTFPGAADAAALQALIDALAYRNASENPAEADRVITITRLVDSGGTAGNGDDTAALDIISTVHVHRTNDAAVITGTATGNAAEAGSVDNGTPTATGNLNSTDVDNPNDAWSAVAPGAGTIGGFGTYAVTADGQWTYTLDNTNTDVQALNGAATLTDTFNVMTTDGTTQLVTITIHAQNDAAVITGDATGAVAGAGNQTDTGNLDADDVDNPSDTWQAVAAGAATAHGYGTYALSASGVWTYALDNNNADVLALNGAGTLTDTFTVFTQDGTAQVVTVTITGANEAAVITGTAAGNVTEAGSVSNGTPTATGNLNSTDVDNPNDVWSAVAPGAGTIGGFGTYALSASGVWTYILDNTNAAVQALNGAATLTDTFSAVTADGTAQLVTVTIHAQNDAAIITGDAAGSITRGDAGNQIDTGDLNAADSDNAADSWQAMAAGTATTNGYGTYQLTAAGVWTYTLDNNNSAVHALRAADSLTDTFNVLTQDGTEQVVTVTIHAQNDAVPRNDFHGDGKSDIFWTTDSGALALWDLDGFQIDFADYTRLGASAVGRPGADWHVVDTGDVNGDGKTDILWRTDSGQLAVWEMDGNHIIGADYLRIGSTIIGTPGADWHALGLLDADGNGTDDIVWRTDSGALALWELDGNQITFADYLRSGATQVGAPGVDWHLVGDGDFDGDGKGGLLWRTDSGAMATWELDGNQIKSAAFTTFGGTTVGAPGSDWHVVDVADFDGDGKSDILWRTGAPTPAAGPQSGMEPGGGSIAIWEMDGNQIKAADFTRIGSTIVGAPGTDWHILGADDHDGDGKADLLWRTDSGALAIWEMDGTHVEAADHTRIGSTAVGAPGPDWHVFEHRWDIL